MENLVKIFKALSDETRLNILILVSKRNICQKGISKYLGISDSAVSQHIKILKDVGIITGYKEGYYVLYHINKESFNICVDFINSMLSNSSESFTDVFDVNKIHLGCSKECKSIKKCCKRREK